LKLEAANRVLIWAEEAGKGQNIPTSMTAGRRKLLDGLRNSPLRWPITDFDRHLGVSSPQQKIGEQFRVNQAGIDKILRNEA
jgi:hypothetical protein